jgi:tRNA(Ile)-lysidine synthase
MDDIYNRFRNFVLSHSLILPGEKILLSLSAGKDSMFMLHLIVKLQCELKFNIGIFHLNHLTRGEESDKDELFVRAKAEELTVP